MTISAQWELDNKYKSHVMHEMIAYVSEMYENTYPIIYKGRGKKKEIDYKKTWRARTLRNNTLSVYPHKASNGYSVSNMKFNYTVSTYWKNKKWLTSKINRIAKRKKLTQAQIDKIQAKPMPKNLIRTEVAIFGLERILISVPELALDPVKLYISRVERLVTKIREHPDLQEDFKLVFEAIRGYMIDENLDIWKEQDPPPTDRILVLA